MVLNIPLVIIATRGYEVGGVRAVAVGGGGYLEVKVGQGGSILSLVSIGVGSHLCTAAQHCEMNGHLQSLVVWLLAVGLWLQRPDLLLGYHDSLSFMLMHVLTWPSGSLSFPRLSSASMYTDVPSGHDDWFAVPLCGLSRSLLRVVCLMSCRCWRCSCWATC